VKLKELDDYIADKAGQIVDQHKALVLQLTDFFMQKRAAALKTRGQPPATFALSKQDIDNFAPIKAAFP
jgi:hypothetical protein